MAEVYANNVWFVAIALIFLPLDLTGKNDVTTFVEFKYELFHIYFTSFVEFGM